MNLLGRAFKQSGGYSQERILFMKFWCVVTTVLTLIGIIQSVIFTTSKDEKEKKKNEKFWLFWIFSTITCCFLLSTSNTST